MTALETFRRAAIDWAVGGHQDARATAAGLVRGVTSVILVEGVSDAVAVEALAQRSGIQLGAAGVCVIPMGGVTNIRKFLGAFRVLAADILVAGLCDASEERYFLRALESSGFGEIDDRAAMAAVGFFVCVDDLEEEFIRALGPGQTERVLEASGDLRAFRTFQNQPAQRDRSLDRQLRRFLGTTSGRKERYARILVENLDLAAMPSPLRDVLAFATDSTA